MCFKTKAKGALNHPASHVIITRKKKEQSHNFKDVFLNENFHIHKHKMNIQPFRNEPKT